MSHLLRPARLALAALLALPLVSASGDDAQATPAYSWNLSRDMLVPPATNPDGTWTFMESTNASPLVLGSYTNIPGPVVTTNPNFQIWQGMMSGLVGVPLATTLFPGPQVNFTHGVPLAHPGSGSHVAVKWTNPIGGIVRPLFIVGRITDIDRNGGDGVNYYVVQQSTGTVLTTGTVFGTTDLDGRAFSLTTAVGAGDSIYFIIERRTGYGFDTTELDVFIAGS